MKYISELFKESMNNIKNNTISNQDIRNLHKALTLLQSREEMLERASEETISEDIKFWKAILEI